MFKLSHDMAQIQRDVEMLRHHPFDTEKCPKILDDLNERIVRISQIIQDPSVKDALSEIVKAKKALDEFRDFSSDIGDQPFEELSKTRTGSALKERIYSINKNIQNLVNEILIEKPELLNHISKITTAFAEGDTSSMQKLLAQHPIDINACRWVTSITLYDDKNIPYFVRVPLLNMACQVGDIEMVKFLIKKKANVNWYEIGAAKAPVFEAALCGKPHKREIMSLLLDSGAELAAKDEHGFFLLAHMLYRAADKDILESALESLQYLIEEGHYDINNIDLNQAIIETALECRSPELVRLLVYSGAQITYPEGTRKLRDVFTQSEKRRDEVFQKLLKKELKGMHAPDVVGLIGQYGIGMDSLSPEQRKLVLQRCLRLDFEEGQKTEKVSKQEKDKVS